MDGYLLTLGSDAHAAPNASKHFDKAIKEIKEIGFENIFYFEKRKQIQITI
jgi:histidinol phosphatase-like PHP family hydrolase